MRLSKHISLRAAYFVLFLVFIALSFSVDYLPGITIANNFKDFALQMIMVLPPIFILIGLFDVWIKKETIIKHLGKDRGMMSFLWVFLLAAPMAGGLLPAFPIAYSLYKKGARLSVVLVFLGAVGVGRIPMVFFESTFLGWRFSLIRLALSVPLVILGGISLGRVLDKKDYKLPKNL